MDPNNEIIQIVLSGNYHGKDVNITFYDSMRMFNISLANFAKIMNVTTKDSP